jgi:hypothetical protein
MRILPRLERLELCAETLCPDLLDMLAKRCPNLRTLKLDVQVIATREGISTLELNRVADNPDLHGFLISVQALEEVQLFTSLDVSTIH